MYSIKDFPLCSIEDVLEKKDIVVDLFLSAAASALLSMDMVLVLMASDWNGDSSVVESLRVFNAKNKIWFCEFMATFQFKESKKELILQWRSEYRTTQIWIHLNTVQFSVLNLSGKSHWIMQITLKCRTL